MTIDVFCTTGENGAAWAAVLRRSMLRLAGGEHELRFKQITMFDIRDPADGWTVVDHVDFKRFASADVSVAHGVALNRVASLSDADMTLFVDSDVVVTRRHWDDIVVDELCRDPGVGAMGVGYAPTGHQRSFPNAIFMMVRTALLKEINLDFRPVLNGDKIARLFLPDDEADLLGIDRGRTVKCDTGYHVPLAFLQKGYRGIVIPFVDAISSDAKIPIDSRKRVVSARKNLAGFAEHHWNGDLFVAHMTLSRRPDSSPDGSRGRYWIERLRIFFRSRYGDEEII